MDPALVAQLVKQLKIINFWIRLFGILVLATLLILGYLLFRIITYIQDTQHKIESFQQKTSQTLDVQQHLCNTKAGSSILQKTDACK